MLIKKILTLLILVMLYVPFSYAATEISETPIIVDITLNQSINHTKTFFTKNKISLMTDDRWTAISGFGSMNAMTNQSLALMKIKQADNKQVTLQFLILNQDSSHYYVSQPILIAKYDQKCGIHIQDEHNDIQLTVIAKISK